MVSVVGKVRKTLRPAQRSPGTCEKLVGRSDDDVFRAGLHVCRAGLHVCRAGVHVPGSDEGASAADLPVQCAGDHARRADEIV